MDKKTIERAVKNGFYELNEDGEAILITGAVYLKADSVCLEDTLSYGYGAHFVRISDYGRTWFLSKRALNKIYFWKPPTSKRTLKKLRKTLN